MELTLAFIGFVASNIMWLSSLSHYYARNGAADSSKYCYCVICNAYLNMTTAFSPDRDND